MIGKRILSYEVKELIGQGGMGNVYLAVHVTSGEKVAIKCLLPELIKHSHIRERFKNEANTMSLLPHPNIVKLLGFKDDEEGAYIIMEYIEGKELDKYIKTESGPMCRSQATDVMKGILSAVSFAHDNGVIHRDIKPSNIFVTKEGQVKITDFGIAKVLSESDKKLTKTGIQMGTVYYMSPEQVKGKPVDKRSDIYALGVTFFQMVTGSNPYEGLSTEYEVYSSIVNDPLPSITSIYPGAHSQFDEVIAKATEKDPNQRFADCTEFSTVLEEVATDEQAPATTPIEKKKETTPEPQAHKSISWVYWILALITVAIGGVWQYDLHSQYSKLIESAGDEYNRADYQSALDTYNKAIQKKQYLILGNSNEDIPALKDDCYFQINKKEGDDLLKYDSFSLATSPDYKFSAIEAFRRAKTFKSNDNEIDGRIALCEKIQEAMDYKKDGENANAARSYREAIVLAKQAGVDKIVIEHLTTAKNSVSQVATFENIWIDHNYYQDYQKGMLMHFKFKAHFLQYKTCELVVWFYTSDGIPHTAKSNDYTTTEGMASVSGTFSPGFEKSVYHDYTIFMPYDKLNASIGLHKFNAAIFYNDKQISKVSDYQYFQFVEPVNNE